METKIQFNFFVVDDDIFYLNITKKHLNNLGYTNVTLFTNGTDCLNEMHKNPDIIFLDYNMDTLTGYDVLKKIKRVNPNTFVIMVSGQNDVMAAVDTLKHGAFDYIEKGEDSEAEKFENVIQKVIKVKELLEKSKPSFLTKLFQ